MILTMPMKKRRIVFGTSKEVRRVMAAGILAAIILSICTGCNADKTKTDTESASAELEPQNRSRMFDQIEQGDWSCVKPIEGMEYLWGDSEGEWIRMDVNGDGLPELVNGWELTGLGYDTSVRKINITYIFACQNQTVELVYTDVNDGMEFLYIAGNGNLVYEWCVSGGPCMNLQRLCRFDLKWNKEYLDTLVLYRFPEGDGMDPEYYRENFPDTFGAGGYGTYYLRERKKTKEELADNADGKYTVREYLTEEQFLNAYEKMTGWDFYASQYMY